eukprot:6577570-Prymnesium_polylepis.1
MRPFVQLGLALDRALQRELVDVHGDAHDGDVAKADVRAGAELQRDEIRLLREVYDERDQVDVEHRPLGEVAHADPRPPAGRDRHEQRADAEDHRQIGHNEQPPARRPSTRQRLGENAGGRMLRGGAALAVDPGRLTASCRAQRGAPSRRWRSQPRAHRGAAGRAPAIAPARARAFCVCARGHRRRDEMPPTPCATTRGVAGGARAREA